MKAALHLGNKVGEHESFPGGKQTRSNGASGSGAGGSKSLPCQAMVPCHPPSACVAQAKLKI